MLNVVGEYSILGNTSFKADQCCITFVDNCVVSPLSLQGSERPFSLIPTLDVFIFPYSALK